MKRRDALINLLGSLMSEVSESCYRAGWLGDTECLVPELCRRAKETQEVQSWGHGSVTPTIAECLWCISEELNSWVNLDDMAVGYVLFDPFPIPDGSLESLDREKEYAQTNDLNLEDECLFGIRNIKKLMKMDHANEFLEPIVNAYNPEL